MDLAELGLGCYLNLPPVAVFGLVNVWPGWRQSRLQCVQQNSSYVWRCWWWGPQFCFSSTWADQVVSKVGRVDKTAHLASTSSTWSWSWSSWSSIWSSSTATSLLKNHHHNLNKHYLPNDFWQFFPTPRDSFSACQLPEDIVGEDEDGGKHCKILRIEAVGQDEQDDKNDTVEPWWTKIIDFLRCKDWWWHMIIMQQVAIMGSGGTDKSRSLRCQDWWDIDDSDASKCQRCQYVKSRTTTAERNVFFESLIFTSEGYFIRF